MNVTNTQAPDWFQRVHGAANTAPRWTWADILTALRGVRGGVL